MRLQTAILRVELIVELFEHKIVLRILVIHQLFQTIWNHRDSIAPNLRLPLNCVILV